MKKLIIFAAMLFLLQAFIQVSAAETITLRVREGDFVNLLPIAEDPDGDELTFYFTEPLDEKGQWQTDYGDAGIYWINVTVSDTQLNDTKLVELIVEKVYRPPYFDPPLHDIVADESEEIAFDVIAVDPDGEEISYYVSGLPPGARFVNNRFIWTPDHDTVNKNWLERILQRYSLLRHTSSRTFHVTFTARSRDQKAEDTVKITVFDKNRPPVLEPMENITISEGQWLELDPVAYDPDGDLIKVFYSGFTRKSRRYIDYGEAGTHYVNIEVTDGALSASQTIVVTVEPTNRPPVIAPIRDISVREGEKVEFRVRAHDPDGDELSYWVENAPIGASFDEESQVFTWVPGYETVVGKASKDFEITFGATDSKLNTTQAMRIRVFDKNRPPVITGYSPSEFATVYKNEIITFEVEAYDADGDDLSYRWCFGLFECYDGENRHSRIFTIPGRKNVRVTVSDGQDSQSFWWSVTVLDQERPVPALPTQLERYLQYTVYG